MPAFVLPLIAATGGGGAAAGGAGIGKALTGLFAAGIGLQAYGQFQQRRQAQDVAKAQAAWDLYNSKVAKRQAEAERAATAFEVGQQRKRAKAILSRQRSLIGASGVQMEGSPLLVAEDTAAELAKEEVNIQLRGARKAMRFESQSILDISKASAAKARAAGFGKAAVIGAGASILQGASTAAFRRGQIRGDF